MSRGDLSPRDSELNINRMIRRTIVVDMSTSYCSNLSLFLGILLILLFVAIFILIMDGYITGVTELTIEY